MDEVLLVSLLSDQTIPNVQLINQFISQVDKYLFISTSLMEKKKVGTWIVKACGCDIKESKPSNIPESFTRHFFDLYVNGKIESILKTHLDRAKLFNIKVIDRKMLTSGNSLSSYLGIF
ncbi:MAG TPA: hypothetical protein PLD74_12465 [Prolixibacteraceae bacterium]|jgi:hypothetical protein|nr:hypothetical protein [Prolixibacteraceae bacterium]HQE53166.1 hypothetical protein [Prolixibacteraceae bacterium]HQH77170.1 hypothetical protein [Prolixibacteraceae bacterium]